MKKIFFVLCFLAQALVANKDYELFLKANQYAHDGKFKDALDAYESIKKPSSAIYYNRGLAQYALGQDVEALASFRKAEINASGELLSKVNQSLVIVQNKLGLSEDSWIHRLLMRQQSGVWLGFWQFMFFILLIFTPFWIYSTRRQRSKIQLGSDTYANRVKTLSFPFLLFLLCKIGLNLFAYYYIRQPYAIVQSKDAPVFVGPNKEFDKVGTVAQGMRVELVDENGSWCKMHSRDIKGWMQKEHVLMIKSHN